MIQVPVMPLQNSSSSSSSSTPKKNYSYKDLCDIELRRREILRRSELPYWKILRYYDGTCLRALSGDWLLWCTMTLFVSIRVHAYSFGVLPEFAKTLGQLDIGIIGGFLSFFLVLFVNQANARFQDLYKESMNAIKRIYDITSSVATTALPATSAQRLIRYLHAAHAAGYVGLANQTYTKSAVFDTLNEMYGWLTENEMQIIQQSSSSSEGPDVCHILVEWCMKDIDRGYRAQILEVKDFVAMREKLMMFRASINTLYEYNDQPIHFFYIHFLCLLSTLYLPLFAISNAYKAGTGSGTQWLMADILWGLIVLLQAIFVIGLRMLGRKMVDPYGDDLEDLSVLTYIHTAWQRSQTLLHAQFPEDVDVHMEERLCQKRAREHPKPKSTTSLKQE
jgi:predicted membrane chloride channel (bestrophin family)